MKRIVAVGLLAGLLFGPGSPAARASMAIDWRGPSTFDFNPVLTDAVASYVVEYLVLAADPGSYALAFDYRSELSPEYESGSFPDAVFASLYFTDDLDYFSIEGNHYAAALGLADFDYRGAANVNGNISASPAGQDWQRFTGEFSSTYQYTVLAFELASLNNLAGDSLFEVANVTAIPEPGSGSLLVLGGLSLCAARARRHKGQPGRPAGKA